MKMPVLSSMTVFAVLILTTTSFARPIESFHSHGNLLTYGDMLTRAIGRLVSVSVGQEAQSIMNEIIRSNSDYSPIEDSEYVFADRAINAGALMAMAKVAILLSGQRYDGVIAGRKGDTITQCQILPSGKNIETYLVTDPFGLLDIAMRGRPELKERLTATEPSTEFIAEKKLVKLSDYTRRGQKAGISSIEARKICLEFSVAR